MSVPIDTLPYHAITLVRDTDDGVSAHRTEALHDASAGSLLKQRVTSKLRWLRLFPSVTYRDVTPAFRGRVLCAYLRNQGDEKSLQLARAFVDVHTLATAGFLHGRNGIPARGGWLLRKSAVDDLFLKQDRVLVAVFPHTKSRIMHVRGIGFYILALDNLPVSPLTEESLAKVAVRCFPCLLDAINHLLSTNGMQWSRSCVKKKE